MRVLLTYHRKKNMGIILKGLMTKKDVACVKKEDALVTYITTTDSYLFNDLIKNLLDFSKRCGGCRFEFLWPIYRFQL